MLPVVRSTVAEVSALVSLMVLTVVLPVAAWALGTRTAAVAGGGVRRTESRNG